MTSQGVANWLFRGVNPIRQNMTTIKWMTRHYCVKRVNWESRNRQGKQTYKKSNMKMYEFLQHLSRFLN